jgi:hypothetical protein
VEIDDDVDGSEGFPAFDIEFRGDVDQLGRRQDTTSTLRMKGGTIYWLRFEVGVANDRFQSAEFSSVIRDRL